MKFTFSDGDRVHTVELIPAGQGYSASVEGQMVQVRIIQSEPGEMDLMIGEYPERVHWAVDGKRRWISMRGKTYVLTSATYVPGGRQARRGAEPARSAERTIIAPMPGHVRAVQVAEGDAVGKGQTLLLLEAMKMEIRIQAPRAGRVARLLVRPGQAVERDQILGEIA
jgi:geranyl-CoA carboxylase alpha subunit